jgi:hypothetical protein
LKSRLDSVSVVSTKLSFSSQIVQFCFAKKHQLNKKNVGLDKDVYG